MIFSDLSYFQEIEYVTKSKSNIITKIRTFYEILNDPTHILGFFTFFSFNILWTHDLWFSSKN